MSTKQVQSGRVWKVTAPTGGLTGNAIYVMTGMIGVVLQTVTGGAIGNVAVEGVWTLPKTAGQAYTVGQKLYSTSTGAISSTASGNVPAGFARAAAATGAASADVKLWPF